MTREITRLPTLPERARDAHKGDFGRVLIVAGSTGMTGAGCMAARAAQRAGAGLVTLAVPAPLNLAVESQLMSVMSRPLPDDDGSVLGPAGARAVINWAEEFDAIALGPGLGRARKTEQTVRRLCRELDVPMVIDADGLNALAGAPGVLRGADSPRLLTPHPGEMSRLVGHEDPARVQADRRSVAEDFALRWSCVLALKGAGTVVTDGRRSFVNTTGNPGMATGGTGDVLTGMAVGLLAQGVAPFDALQLAVFVHGLAGDLAAQDLGEGPLMAEDLLDYLPRAFVELRARRERDPT
jgi:NAD(P)H-hydrate epimerase